jgi:SAM-dependent methyltransferase
MSAEIGSATVAAGTAPISGPARRPAGETQPRVTYGYRHLDFSIMWRDRGRVTEVEVELLRRGLASARKGRALEIGVGGGRLTPLLTELFDEYVGLDATGDYLKELRRAPHAPTNLFVGDVQALPFLPGEFDAVAMVRVYNFLPDPARAIEELYRVLAPGGMLVFSYFAVPSLVTLQDDVKVALHRPLPDRWRPRTFRRLEIEHPRRARVDRLLTAAGFRIVREYACGTEDFRPLRWLPKDLFVGVAGLALPWTVLPHRFVAARRPEGAGS